MPFYYRLSATTWLLLAFFRAKWQFRRHAARSINLPPGIALGPEEQSRFKHYFYGTSYLAVLLCSLRNRPLSPRETYLFANLSALSACFDDLVDTFQLGADPNVQWKNNPEAFGLLTDKRGLSLHLLANIYREIPEKDLEQFRAYMHRVFNVETAGRQKVKEFKTLEIGSLETEAIAKITLEKGGSSVLLFRSILAHPLSETEENALFQFGFLIQCCDDIFDLWHDRQAGTITLATLMAERSEINLLAKMFEQQVRTTYRVFRQTAYPTAQVETAIHIMHYLVSLTRVCLRHYQNLEYKYGILPLENRTLMVVDMDLWANRFKVARFLFRPIQ